MIASGLSRRGALADAVFERVAAIASGALLCVMDRNLDREADPTPRSVRTSIDPPIISAEALGQREAQARAAELLTVSFSAWLKSGRCARRPRGSCQCRCR